ncbi:hypothetical protein GCM10029992_13770 [Glycomyces albus]
MSEAYSPIPELNLLKEFADRIGPVFYSEGFELLEYAADIGLHNWSDHPEFLSRLVPSRRPTAPAPTTRCGGTMIGLTLPRCRCPSSVMKGICT